MLRKIRYRGMDLIDVRVWTNRDGESYPTRKGISMTPAVFQEFVKMINEFVKREGGEMDE